MTKKDYILISNVIAGRIDSGVQPREQLTGLVRDLAWKLAADNPRFDRAKFIDACLGSNNQ